ncbi:major capsid protein [Escherichia coli]|uniref:major capsid protein n=1 Tax=Escherichia coli TaxID=562 RepID=UPI000F892BB7|nr:major capsid protein [Escherichia coli]
MKKIISLGSFLVAAFSAPSFAADSVTPSSGVDLSQLTNSIDFGSVLTGIMAVAASLVVLYAGIAGVRWILRTVKSA